MYKNCKVVNLTPHDVTVRLESGEELFFPATGEIARVKTVSRPAKDENGQLLPPVAGVPVVEQKYEDVQGLPDPQEGVYYLVSLVVRQAVAEKGRTDCISPDTSPTGAIRNEQGHIIAVRQFVR